MMGRTLLCTGLLFAMSGCGGIRMTGIDPAPFPLTEFNVQALDEVIVLSWTNPNGLSGTLIRYSEKETPAGPFDGYPPPNGNAGRFTVSSGRTGSFRHTDLSNGTTYYYAAFAYDESAHYSKAVTGSGIPRDGTAPGAPIFFSARAGEGLVSLRWAQGVDDDAAGTLIRFSTAGFPKCPTDGAVLPGDARGIFPGSPASRRSFLHANLMNGSIYYYAAFTYDEVPNYSAPMFASALPGDSTPPSLAIDILQNTLTTSRLDFFLRASEPLDPESVELSANGDRVAMKPVDSKKNLWRGGYLLTGTGTVFLAASARDPAGLAGSANSTFAATLLPAGRGGSAVSPDKILEIRFPPDALPESTYIIVRTVEQSTPFGKIRAGGSHRISYRVSPEGLLGGGEAEVAVRYDSLDLLEINPGRLRIRDDEFGVPLRPHIDPERRTASVNVTRLGGISIALEDAPPGDGGDTSFVVLEQNRPNPFNPTTAIRFDLPSPQQVRLDIFGVSGRRVRTLLDQHLTAGRHSVTWNGTDESGVPLAGGVYFCRLQAQHRTVTGKMVLLR